MNIVAVHEQANYSFTVSSTESLTAVKVCKTIIVVSIFSVAFISKAE